MSEHIEAEKVIVVTYASDVLGSGEFWRGGSDDLPALKEKQIIAHSLARAAAKDGKPHRMGMWRAEIQEATDD